MTTTFEKRSISLELSLRMINAAEKRAAELGIAIAVTIVDESGVLKAFGRMDGAALVAVDLSRKKAITAVGFGLSTGSQWYEFVKDDPILLHGAQSITDFSMFGGGSPVRINGSMVGGVGVSGAHYHQDEECTKAALALLE